MYRKKWRKKNPSMGSRCPYRASRRDGFRRPYRRAEEDCPDDLIGEPKKDSDALTGGELEVKLFLF